MALSKILFSIDITDKKNPKDAHSANAFLTAEAPEENQKAVDDAIAAQDALEKKKELPLWAKIAFYILTFLNIVIFGGIVKGLGNVSFAQAWQNAPEIFLAFPVVVVLDLALYLWQRGRGKQISNSYDAKVAKENLDRAITEMDAALGLPEKTHAVDILVLQYCIKNEAVAIKATANFDTKLFIRDDALCFSVFRNIYTIPRSCITGIRTIKYTSMLISWNKPILYNEGRYQQYKIVSYSKNGTLACSPTYALTFTDQGVNYELYFPAYELPIFEQLTGYTPTNP